MDRFKQFLRKKGFYIALGTGVLAFAGLMVVHNYNRYQDEFGVGKSSVDLNAPVEEQEDTEPPIEAKVEMPVTEANSADALAGDTDADAEAAAGSPKETEAAGGEEGAATETADDTEQAGDADAALEADSDGVIVNAEGEIVANSYNEGGVLVWPVDGTVILPYSMDTTVYYKTLKSYRCNPGVLIRAEEGSNVLAAYEGVVESVHEEKEHGTVVTINMGNGYMAKYGQLMNVTVSEGDVISTAQNIGEVAPVTSYYAEEGTHVYFELEKNEVPVNPVIYMQ